MMLQRWFCSVALFCAVSLSGFAQAQFAGTYTGIIYIRVGNEPERSAGAVLLSVSTAGEISASGLSGRVNSSGAIAWDTPNALYLTTGTIANGTMSATGSRTENGVTTTTRLDAKNNTSIASPNADPVLDTLTWVNPHPFGATLQAVIHQTNQFVAVGGGGMVAISSDGRSWQSRATPSRRMMNGIAHGKNTYVAVGEGETIMTSPNGQDWTLRGTPSAVKFDLSAVAFGNNRFLAVGSVGNSFYSDDGVVWTARTSTGIPYVDVKFLNGKFVILGFNPGGAATVSTSTDGATWSAAAALGAGSVVPIRGIAFGNGKYLVCATASDGFSRIFQSTDATAWTMNSSLVIAGASTNAIKFNYLTFNDGKFMAFDGSNYSYTSVDGITWQRGQSVTRPPKAVAFGGSRYAAVGETISSSGDGISWEDHVTRRHSPHINFVGGKMPNYVYVGEGGYFDAFGLNNSGLGVTNDLYYAISVTRDISDFFMGDGGFLRLNGFDYTVPGRERLRGSFPEENTAPTSYVYGDAGAIYALQTTTLFTNSTTRTIITNIVRRPTPTGADLLGEMVFNNNRFVFGRGGTILRATNTFYTNWLSVASGVTADLYSGSKPNYSNALAVIVGDQGTILTSPNGLAWTKRVSGTTEKLIHFSYQEVSIFSTSRVYTAVSDNTTVLVSHDHGTNWTIVATNNFGRKLRSVFAPSQASAGLVAVGDYGLVASSDNRTNWTHRSIEADLAGAVYGNGRWVVRGPFYSLVSLDGIRWELHSFKYRGSSMGYGNGKFVVLTTGGILTSYDAINWREVYKGPTGAESGAGAVAYAGGRWTAVGSTTNLTSLDGENWSPAPGATVGFAADVRHGNGTWVAVGSSGMRAYSTNGVNWTANNSNSTDHWRALAYGKGLWVLVGSSGRLSTSTNGIAWTVRNQSSYQFTDVEWVGDRFIAIGSASNTNVALVSTNGTNWVSIGLPVQPTVNALASANGTLLIVGANGTILQGSYPVNGLPAISVSPSTNIFLNAGAVLNLKATVSGQAPFQYLWSRNGVPLSNGMRISGATSDTLSVQVNAEEDGGDYTLEVSNSVGSRVSFPITVTVAAPPTFLIQPLSQTALLGGSVTFVSSAKGSGVTYQWFRNGAALPGQTNATLTLTNLQAVDVGAYTVVASNSNGPRTSAVAALSISAAPTFAVDASFPGSSLNFSNWAGYPAKIWAIAPLSDGKRLIGGTFKIQQGTSVYTGIARLNADGTVDTTFTPPSMAPPANQYFRAAVRTILPLPDGRFLVGGIQTSGNGPVLLQANGAQEPPLDLLFQTSGGTPYISSLARQADGKIVMAGNFVLNGLFNHGRLNSNLTLDTSFGNRSSQLVPAEAYAAAIQTDQKILVGSTTLTRLETNGLRDFNFPQNFPATYSMVVMPDGRVALGGQNITMMNASGAVDPNFQVRTDGAVGALVKLPDGGLVAGGGFTTINNLPIGPLGLIRNDGTLDANFKFNLGAGGLVSALAVEANGTILVGGSFKSINGLPATNFARLTAQQANVPLAIVQHPQSLSADMGETVTLSVAASGGAPLNFQWRKNGAVVAGATQSSLTLSAVTTNDVANYTVDVSDPSGRQTSQSAALTVAGISPAGQAGGFTDWAASNNIPANSRGAGDDPDGDRLPNIFEYFAGTNPTVAASGAVASGASVTSGGQKYPAIVFIRSKAATGVVAEVQVSSKVNFTDSLGATQESVVDLGNGTERVTMRSAVNDRAQPVQFLRLRLSLQP